MGTKFVRYPVSVTFNQPTRDILLELDSLLDMTVPVYINRVELALDVLTNTASDAEVLQHRVARMVEKRWERNGAFESSGTVYIGRGSGRSQMVLYSDRPSKVQRGRSCLHIEYRLRTVSKVREIGIRLVGDLVNFDHHLFWQQHLRLFQIDRAKLGKMLARRYLNSRDRASTRGYDKDLATAGLVLRHISYGSLSPQTLGNNAIALREYGVKKLGKVLVPVHASCVVPWPVQSVWPRPL